MTLRLLVADDSITIQKTIGLAFSGEDVAIETAQDGDSALDKFRAFRPDVVLADVFMPGCSGYEICSRIKEDPEFGHTPVILLAGTFEPFDEAEAARVGCDGWLTKPFDTDELIRKVHSAAGGKASAVRTAVEAAAAVSRPAARVLVSRAAWDSFLGDKRILDLFDSEMSVAPQRGGNPPPAAVPEDALDEIVERVVRKMSPEVIREVAWEVVPELSEAIIRSTLQKE